MELSNLCLYGLFRFASRIPIVKRIYPSLLKRWAAVAWTGGFKVKRYQGLFFLLNYRNLVDRKIGLHGGYELEQFSYFFSRLNQRGGDIFLDVGANLGLYALNAAQLGIPEIHAFEPDPRNYAQLMGNLYLNKFTTAIRAHQFGLSDKTGDLQFELAGETKTNLTKVAVPGATSPTETLPVKPLDKVLTCTGKKIFLKIDAEGHEFAVLQGAAQLLKNNDCFLQVEAWPDNAAVVMKYLEGFSYQQIHRIQNDYYFQRSAHQ